MAKLSKTIRIEDLPPARLTLEEAFRRWCGFVPAIDIAAHGKFQRFGIPEGDPGKSGWAITAPAGDGVSVRAGDWAGRAGGLMRWSSREDWDLTDAEIAERDRAVAEAEAEADALRGETALRAEEIYRSGALAVAPDNSPYFVRKHVANHGSAVKTGWWYGQKALVIPLTNPDGVIKTLQYILEDGTKKFLPGGEKKGHGLLLGAKAEAGARRKAFLCEGYATGWSVRRATGMPVLIAFDAGNLKAAAEEWGQWLDLTCVADNDASGTGERKALETGLPVILVPEEGMDANDYMNAHGAEALRALLLPPPSWLAHGDSLLSPDSGVEWLIRKQVQRGGNIMLFGPSNAGKTFLVLDMLLTMSTGGGDWHGYRAKEAGCVYLCGEGLAGIGKRLAAWLKAHGKRSTGKLYVSRGSLPLDRPDGLEKAIAEMRRLPWEPEAIAIETLSWFISGDENKAQDSSLFLQGYARLREEFGKGLTVILVTHSGVADEDRARGSSVFRGAMDTEMRLRRGDDGVLVLEQTKQKELEIQPPLRLALEEVALWPDPDPDAAGETVSSAVIRLLGKGAPAGERQGKGVTAAEAAAARNMERLTGIWLSCGAPLDAEGLPRVTEADIRDSLKAGGDISAAKNWLKDAPGRPLRSLADRGRIAWEGGAVTIIDPADSSAAMLRRKALLKAAGGYQTAQTAQTAQADQTADPEAP